MAKKYADQNAVLYILTKIKSGFIALTSKGAANGVAELDSSGKVPTSQLPSIPSKTSDLTNDSGYITTKDIPEGAAASTTSPKMDGVAAVGEEAAFARGDHVHPSDTSRVPITRKVNGKALGEDITLTAADVSAVPTTRKVNNKALSANITLSASDVGAVPTARSINGKALTADITLVATDVSAIPTNARGSSGGVAPLDADGKIPSEYLPSFVDDVIEGYYYNGQFYSDSAHTGVITAERGKIYLDVDTNLSYRYGGTTFTMITSSDMVAITNDEIDAMFNNA